ncbi:organic hydroperoxide resistance protein [Cognatishimia activa]|uniref:organic hydroperoxide resistance protein n=1 Tax=Cognatishimia activa TaxID=1715691 RepID=UPI0022325EB4|nr:organic hydroperoxide resistance protein [Cognatishimia activa]UZD90799.1 organic hydroperoxide resistance protein [Cognatishimia activa]
MAITPAYQTSAIATGGRDGSARTEDGSFEVTLAAPTELGGTGKGNNPEQLFAAGYAACFIGAMKFATTQDKTLAKVPEDATVKATVGIGAREDKGFGLVVALEVRLPGVNRDEAQRTVDAGHTICPYSHAVNGNIEVTTSIV